MCTLEKRGNIFSLTLTGDDQHRLNPTLIASLLLALHQATRGSVLITTSEGKSFSTGLDLAWAHAGGSNSKPVERLFHMVEMFKLVVAELISLPMPTVAAVQGNAVAAGLLLALSHDYVLIRSDKGVLCMSEVNIGLTVPDYCTALFRAKLGSAAARRQMLLGGTKVTGEEAVRMGIVDAAHDSERGLAEATMRLAEQLALRKWQGDVYKEIRKSMYPELCGLLGLGDGKAIAKL